MSRNLNPVFIRVGINQLWRSNIMPDSSGTNLWNSYSHQFVSYLQLYKQLEVLLSSKLNLKIAHLNIFRIKWANILIFKITACFFQPEKKPRKSKYLFYKKLYEKSFKKCFVLIKNFQLLKFLTLNNTLNNEINLKKQKLIIPKKQMQKNRRWHNRFKK